MLALCEDEADPPECRRALRCRELKDDKEECAAKAKAEGCGMGSGSAGYLLRQRPPTLPPTTGPGSTYYHMAEAAACLVLAGTGAGRFAGLDFIFYAISARLWPANSEQRTHG